MKMSKRILSIMLAIITLVSVVSVSAEALKIVVYEGNDEKYGYMAPVNYKGTEVLSTVKVYGSYDYINFYINSPESETTYYFYEIYSDKKLTKCVQSDAVEITGKGNYTYSLKLKLKGNYSTKTYYVVTYAAMYEEDNDLLIIDAESMYQFKLQVNRTTSFSKQKVMLTEMKNTTKGAYIKWSSLSGTYKYNIYRRSVTGSKWTKVGTVSSSKTSFTDTSVKDKNVNYIYTVKAVNKKGTISRYHYQGLTCLFAKTPTMKSIAVAYDNAVEIKWNSTSSKAKYDIMRKEGDGSWEIIKTNYSGTSFKDTTANSGEEYTYSVKAVISTSYGKAVSSYYANSDLKITYLDSPVLNKALKTATGVNVTWEALEGSVGYTILRKKSDDSTGWSSVGKVGADVTSFIDETADIKTGYIYSVRSEAAGNKGSYNRTGIEYFYLDKPVVSVEDLADDNNNIKISWSKIPNATDYEVWFRAVEGEWALLTTMDSTSLSYIHTLNKVGDFEYKVCAVRNEEIFSEYSDSVAFTQNPVFSYDAIVFSDGVELGWADYGYESYNVYRKLFDAPDEEYTLIGSVSNNKFKDTTAETNVSYQYQVFVVHNGIELRTDVIGKMAGILADEEPAEIPSMKVCYDTLYNQTTDVMYGYDFENGCWERVDNKLTRESYKAYYNDGKYRFAFSRDGGFGLKTPVDNSILDYEWYDKKVEFTAKLKDRYILELTINNVPEEIEEYEIRVGTKEVEIKTDGSDTYTCEIGYFCNTSTNLASVGIIAKTENGDISVTSDHFYYMGMPEFYDYERLSNGNVKLTISQYNCDEIGRDGYYIYRKVYGEDSYEKIAVIEQPYNKFNTVETTYTDKTAQKGVKYVYLVKSYKIYDGVEYVSYYDKVTIK